ncbi:acriflavin resistance protein D [Candidatus Scalindua japonica]|uniref:Acriflavin resistance protein D n=1 Tax=Candidatus Scalindua japonica TaxID=1284222 RepID=A0A286U088_9BACT|nr:efflux RND transporter permease subunit [Candidatus Scalindua japonica]GAX61534.1 acriflavin resistance protein D [Candidatus Scalindua japonica]
MNLIKKAIEQPITVAVGIILIIIAGIIAITRVPVQMTPEVEDTVIAVTTRWENSSPQEVESEIIDDQEEKLQGLSNLRSMSSVSQRGQGQIRLEFATGVDKDTALREVSDKLREVPNYPVDVDEPVIDATDPESNDYIAWFLMRTPDPDFDIQALKDFVEDRVKPILERVPGLSESNVLGGRERETQIHFDPVLMAQRRITVPDFIRAIQATNRNFSAGAMAQSKLDIRVRALGRFSSPDQILDTIIRQDESGSVYVRDVATVVETLKEKTDFVRSNGQNILAMNFQKEPGANVMEVMAKLKEEAERIKAKGGILDSYAKSYGIKGGLELFQVYDQTDYINQAFDLVKSSIVIGGILAVIALLTFLRSLRSIGIIAIAIPISIVGSIVVMVALGRSINVISLAGMAFAVGMVVDNSIVVLENVFRHMEMGKSKTKAALDGATEVSGAVLASTLTTLLVFIPILLIQETSGQLMRDIALAIIAAVGLSYIVSITVVPCGAALFLKVGVKKYVEQKKTQIEKPMVVSPGKLAGITNLFRTVYYYLSNFSRYLYKLVYWLNGSMMRRVLIISVFIIVTLLGIIVTIPPIDYLPTGNRNLTFGIMIPPPGYNVKKLRELGERVEKKIRPFWEAGANPNGMDSQLYKVPSDIVPNSPSITPPPIKHYFQGGGRKGATLFHGCISADPRRVVDLVSLFKASTTQDTLPGVYSFAFQSPLFRMGGSSGSAVKIDLVGSDLEDVSQSASALFGTLVQEYGSFAVRPDPVNFNVPAPELQIIPDLDRMTDLNLTVEDLGLTIQANSDGALIGDYDLGGDIIDLKLISKDAIDQTTITNLGDAKMTTSDGVILDLDTISDFKWRRAPEQIKRVDRQRAVTLEFTPPKGMPLQKAINGINQKVAELKKANAILPGVEIQLAGAASKLTEVKEALLGDGSASGMLSSALFLAVMIVYLLMCILFQSWIYPFVIMFSVPLATFGGFLGLSLVHYWSEVDRYMPVQNMDVLTIIGFVILAGVVVNNAILIVAQTLNFLQYDKKLEPRKAISMAVESRVRPIFMSMSTSVGGMLPLVLMPGSGSELYRGLGAVVVGGLFISTIFTLILIPILLGLMFDLKDKMRSVTRFQHVTGALLLIFTFSGCAVGKNYIQPRTMVSEDWQTGLERGLVSKPSELKHWWTSFEDTQLNKLIREAVDGNYDIKIAVARVREARARRAVANANLFPLIDALGSYSKTRNSETTDTGIKNVSFNKRQTIPMEIYSTGFDSAWELDIFGGVRRSVEAATAEVDEIHAELHDIMVTLLSELAVNYIELRNTQNRLGIAKANVKTQEETLKLTKARFDSGLTDELDTAQAETNLENTRAQIPVLEEQLNHALNRIAVLTGKQPGALNIRLTGIGSIPVPPKEVAIGLPAALLRRRPDIRMAERALAAETARIGVAESDLYPKFFLKNSFGFSASNGGDVFKPGSQTFGVGPSVTWRIFSSGQIRNNIKAQNEREKQALYRFHNTVLSALEEVESAVISYSREMNRRDTLQKTVKAAEKTVKLAKIQYTNGLTDFNNLLDAERTLFTFQDQLSISEARVSKNLISLYKALGGGWDLDNQG